VLAAQRVDEDGRGGTADLAGMTASERQALVCRESQRI
jgi:hypothetical protein